MKKLTLFAFIVFITFNYVFSQTDYEFTDIIRLKTTEVKDQYASGTCWSFSAISFLESEMIRMGAKDLPDLSEMFVVRLCYSDKAEKYMRLGGNLNFGAGGAFHDVTYVLENYGLVPESIYAGLNYGTKSHYHMEMDAALKAYVGAIKENENGSLSTAWLKGLNGVLDAYLGELPENFEFNGKNYTPKSYASEVIKLNPDDYIEISSYTHHPFYETFMLEVADNWLWGSVYNLPLDDMMKVFDYSLENGYTIAWAADVSEDGFSHTKYGVAVVPQDDPTALSDTEKARWETLTEDDKETFVTSEEKAITQAMRQEAFDNYQTTDDHGMHIIGTAKDANGNKFYIVKNSWNTDSKYDGYFYASEAFVKYKTMDIMVNKNAIPKDIKTKLGL
jgi:bleomycin hydrolase